MNDQKINIKGGVTGNFNAGEWLQEGNNVIAPNSNQVAGGDQLIEQSGVSADTLAQALAQWQQAVLAQIDGQADLDADEKEELKAEASENIDKAVEEINGKARPSWIARRLNAIAAMGDDIVEVTAALLTNPFAGAGLILKKVGQKIEVQKALPAD